ncbi:hypothetical protein MmiHf6_08440 [Methanimicrococcus hongohii]|uniref:Antitoxin SocA-like Panacea domain-containing protein n=1 Tax=Methanimicrococcus hongohii TaxID=3028295 RepID=A0AA96V1E1_9EURY|nr:Panacea domain-containing protein [Methanimicrococcus sp. Hf6]WNY23535.1 hypothetical protein MmiHf6_08440 [Methanimicrococcus sp. Hf6]
MSDVSSKPASQIAKWFVQNFDLTNDFCDQVKLQKLLFFSWLIHKSKFDESLFDDMFYAFENGPVVKTIYPYLCYDSLFSSFKDEPLDETKFSENEKETLNTAYEIFHKMDWEELVEISHESPAWIKFYNDSLIFEDGVFKGYHSEKAQIPKEELKTELQMIENVLYVYENLEEFGYNADGSVENESESVEGEKQDGSG